MNFNEYQQKVANMPLYDDPLIGLFGEVGEVAELIKKDRRPEGRRKPYDPVALKAELGDVLWYLARLSWEHGFSLQDVANFNIEKLEKRHGG